MGSVKSVRNGDEDAKEIGDGVKGVLKVLEAGGVMEVTAGVKGVNQGTGGVREVMGMVRESMDVGRVSSGCSRWNWAGGWGGKCCTPEN